MDIIQQVLNIDEIDALRQRRTRGSCSIIDARLGVAALKLFGAGATGAHVGANVRI